MLGLIEKNLFFKKKVIKREDNKDYLVRYTLCNNRWFSIKVHHLLISDDSCLHNHPWLFKSLILKGGYWEITPDVDQHKLDVTKTFDGSNGKTVKKWYGPGSFLNRPAHWIHRLELPEGQTCWTFVITFKKTKEWGFFTRQFGFLNWQNYRSKEHCDE
jgi:hypothetical protein